MGGSPGGVEILSRRLVRPESSSSPDRMPSEPEVIHLTPWDLRLITVDHIQKGILLPMPRAGGAAQVIDNLASSFARALDLFYPLAGRLTASEVTDGVSTPSFVISLCCNNEGAEFVHAMAPGVTVRDITTCLYIPSVVWSLFPLNRLLSVDAVVDSLPVLAAQVTELEDGIFIAMSLNHGVADGTAFWRFFNTWSEINRSSGGNEGYELSTPLPMVDRWFLDTCPVPIPLPFGKLEDIVLRPEYTPVRECFFHFSAESIKKLKTKANAEMAGTATATISSLQSLLAHIWRAVCRARQLAPHLETEYRLVIGCRGRVKGIPQEYMGNAVRLGTAESTVGDVLDKGLGWVAWLLNRVVASFDEAQVMGDLASWAREPKLAHMRPSRNPAYAVTGSSPRFDVYGNDFGWGGPVAVRSGAGNKLDGKVTVYEGRGGGGSMALEVCLSPEALARLIADEEFMEAVTVGAA
ncbi:hypothetical protein GQ55_6G011400 [Panicum hallii var. hallii]|uniref:Acetyltransferase n=1 Tax=Panicum hallii var. hallii TaxID=1504633 RepID=A0A2T7D2M3_9POAL|nr:hypothetical protein GQ55_6G011400 [Panicum hallii var. hallii]